MSDDAGRSIARRDEVLELLYWLEGERLPGASTLDAMTRFLSLPAAEIAAALAALEARGDVRRGEAGEHRLTEDGRREAARRFAEEFASLIGPGRGECNNPECECHTSPEGATRCSATS